MTGRFIAVALLVALAWPSVASAEQYYTGADQARFARLLPLTGTYRCSDTGGDPPYKATVKVEGAWLVWRESNADPATEYVRWSPARHAYVIVELENAGEYSASTTSGADPLNATWTHEYPADKRYGTFATTFARGSFTVTAKYLVNGKQRIGRLACHKLQAG